MAHTLTIAEIKRPPEGKDRGSIVGIDGAKFGCFREKLHLFAVGATYEIEVTDGQYQNVKSAKLLAAGATPASANGHAPPSAQHPVPSSPSEKTGGSGNGYYRPTSPEDAERMFVCATLTALIRAGEVKNDKAQLFHTVQMLRLLWQHTLGNGSAAGTFFAGETNGRHQ